MNLSRVAPTPLNMGRMQTPRSETDADVVAATDELLAIRCRLGEPEAFALLVDRWHDAVWRYTRRLTGDDESARETVQDIWLRVVRSMPRLRDPTRLRPWLFGIARRAIMDRVRERYAAPDPVSIDDVDVAAADLEEDSSDDVEALREELARVPFVGREALILFYLRELTLEQIAEVLAIPVGTVKSRLFRARRLLREQLAERGLER